MTTIPRWGFVTAKPSEFLVHVRGGRVLEKSSGQGASAFKWPWDSIALVPTTLQKLQFRADQVTAEKVGVEVVGLAVYRIADPLLAYRVLDFDGGTKPQDRLVETLTAMFVGATRRLVANLGIEACLTERKSAISTELLREIAPVVGGRGRPDDMTQQGWGVVIDTLEIQEVRILSEKVFAALQAPYRTAIDQRAREAKAEAENAVATKEATYQRSVAERKLDDERAVGERMTARDLAESARRSQALIERARLAELEAGALIKAAEIEAQRAEVEAKKAVAKATLEVEVQRIQAEGARLVGESQAALALVRAQADQVQSEADARRMIAEKLPALAAAMGQRIQEVRVHSMGGTADPLASLAHLARAAMDLVKS